MFTIRNTLLLCIVAIAALAVALAAACSGGDDSPPEPPTPTADPALSGLIITLSRHGCSFAGCPWGYDLAIRGDGTVTYEGRGEVAAVGPASASIPQAQVRLLSDRFDEISFAEIEETGCSVSDAPYTDLTLIREPGTEKAIEFCALSCPMSEEPANTPSPWDLCSFNHKPALSDLANLIDEVTNSRQWVGLPEKVIELSRGFYPAPDAVICTPLPCKNYTLTIYRDGRVEYEGIKNVDVIGTRSGEILEADVLDLVERFEESGFFDLPSDFHCQVTDVGATTTTVRLLTRGNTIERCHTSGPESPLEPLRQLELVIAELVGLERWAGETD